MNNRVVYTLYHVFARRGFSVLRFNFRGVGHSEGNFDRGEGELSDAASALDWLQSHHPNARECWVAGFSFGAWIGMQLLMRRPEIASFVSVSLPAGLLDFSFLAPCPSSGLVVQGGADQLIAEPEAKNLVDKLQYRRDIVIDYRVVQNADHFFADHMDALSREVESYVAEHAQPGAEA